MRIEFAASAPSISEFVLSFSVGTSTFSPARWMALGYNQYEVVCIGGSGGRGGHAGDYGPSATFLTQVAALGCGGGGGGAHYAFGALEDLPNSVPVVVGLAGVLGNSSLVGSATNGSDGGATTFGGTICQASGGKGGRRGTGFEDQSVRQGGDGGRGGTTIAGGGGLGGLGITPGQSGSWDGVIGSGGGGGVGGIAQVVSPTEGGFRQTHSPGGAGCYDGQPNNLISVPSAAAPDTTLLPILLSGRAWDGGGANALFLTNYGFYAGTRHHAVWPVPGTPNGACFVKLKA